MTQWPAIAGSKPSVSGYDSQDRVLFFTVMAISAVLVVAHLLLAAKSPTEGSDFFLFWSAAKFVVSHGPLDLPTIYDPLQLQAFQAQFPYHSGEIHPFAYPPSVALIIAPLALLDYPAAKIFWLVLSFVALALAVDALNSPLRLLLIAIAPASLLNIAFEQNGFWTAALIAGGLLRLYRAPVIAGLLLGLASLKPQLCLAIPIVLVAMGAWRVAGIALLSALSVIAVSLIWAGLPVWLAWLSLLSDFSLETVRHIDQLKPYLASLLAAWLVLEGSLAVGQMVQLGFAVVVSVLVVRAASSGSFDRLAVGALAASLALTPFCYIYDTVLIVPAMILIIERLSIRQTTASERLILIACWFGPFLSLGLMPYGVPVMPLVCLGLIHLASRVFWREQRSASAAH